MSIRSKSRQKRRAEVLSDPNDRAHGTTTGYDYGCRCDRCKDAKSKAKQARYQSTMEARRKRLEELIAARNAPKPEPEPLEPPKPPKPNPVKVEKQEAARAQREAKKPKRPILNELDANNMRGCSVSYDPPRCAVCGRYGRVEAHHVVKRSQGGTDGPTIALCGFGNNLKDADGRYLCHGRAEHRMLHFRWVRGEEAGEGWWEYLVTKVPTKYENALLLGGWKKLGGA